MFTPTKYNLGLQFDDCTTMDAELASSFVGTPIGPDGKPDRRQMVIGLFNETTNTMMLVGGTRHELCNRFDVLIRNLEQKWKYEIGELLEEAAEDHEDNAEGYLAEINSIITEELKRLRNAQR